MELDIEALQMLAGDDPVALGDCQWTCAWSDGWACSLSNVCAVSTACVFSSW
ncbi:ALQxL family class IV lanthipeptide [Streptomyces sp. P1-3]|uniref:ALQxL family class IV lanthipeptide n=1 Tax=Streptomyces sp. P1-3 TaxID=3421658 RepID=UPI003D36B4CB